MSSISDIFSPTFLIFLGILVLVVSLLVVYFESKMRDQNHKISSMLNLVSTLAEEVNNVKFGLNHLAINSRPLEESKKFVNIPSQNNLITVSDDEEESDDDEESDDEESDENYDLDIELEETNDLELEENSDEEINDSDSDDENLEDVKVLKLTIQTDDESLSSEVNLDIKDNLTELDDNFSDNESEISENNLEEHDTLEDIHSNLEDSNLKIDLKKISINLEEPHNLLMDYKKLSLAKLRSVVAEKGLADDSSKLKKNELLKLLGAE